MFWGGRDAAGAASSLRCRPAVRGWRVPSAGKQTPSPGRENTLRSGRKQKQINSCMIFYLFFLLI